MERTWLTFHCWLYILYIIVYVTNKNLVSWIMACLWCEMLIYTTVTQAQSEVEREVEEEPPEEDKF